MLLLALLLFYLVLSQEEWPLFLRWHLCALTLICLLPADRRCAGGGRAGLCGWRSCINDCTFWWRPKCWEPKGVCGWPINLRANVSELWEMLATLLNACEALVRRCAAV